MTNNIKNTYEGVRVRLDNNSFTQCNFSNCVLEFSGNGPVELNECTFSKVDWVFSGSAQNTLNFLQGMYHGMGEGGRQIVETTFDNIKKNVTSQSTGRS